MHPSREEEAQPLVPGGTDAQDHTKEKGASGNFHYDDFLEKAGFGRYQLLLLLLCGWANASDAVEMMVVSFIVASTAECDLELDDARKGWITASVFIGMMFGGWIWGSVADKHGRKPTLAIAMLVNAVFGGLCALANTFGQFLIFRIISGLGVGGSMPIVFSYFCEFLPPSRRGALLTFLAAFWMVGSMLVAGLAWVILGSTDCPHWSGSSSSERCALAHTQQCSTYDTPFGIVSAWRVLALSSALPALLAAIGMVLAPESPKWLLQQGFCDRAQAILARMAQSNGKYLEFPPDMCLIQTASDSPASNPHSPRTCLLMTTSSVVAMYRGTKALFEKDSRRTTLLLSGVWFAMCFGFYGLLMWLPDFYREGGVSDDTDPYLVSFLVALSNLPGNLLSAYLIERVGRRLLLVATLALSGASVFAIFGVHSSIGTVIFSCVFSGVSVAGWNALDVVSVELFPTRKRGTAFGFLAAVGRVGAILGNTLFARMGGNNTALPLVLTGAALVAGGSFSMLLPSGAREIY